MANWRSYIDPSVGDGQNTIDGIIANGSTYGLQISDDFEFFASRHLDFNS